MVFDVAQEGSFTSIILVGPWYFFHTVQKYELPHIDSKKVNIQKNSNKICLFPPFFNSTFIILV